MGDATSRLRKRLRELSEVHQAHLDQLLHEAGPLFRGTFGTRSRVCGNPTCHCFRGQLHVSKYLSASDGGAMRQVHVPAADEVRVGEGAERYRRFYKTRRRLADLHKQQLELADALGRSLLAPYPPDDPLPPPRRRGRRPKKEARRGRR